MTTNTDTVEEIRAARFCAHEAQSLLNIAATANPAAAAMHESEKRALRAAIQSALDAVEHARRALRAIEGGI